FCSWRPASSITSRTSATTCSCGACSMVPVGARSADRAARPMLLPDRPHVLGIDDGPFEKYKPHARAPIGAVMMEGHDLVEAIAVTEFPVDGAGVTGFLADWIRARRFAPALDGVVFGGITLAGLAVLDPGSLARELGAPVVVVNRKERSDAPLRGALAVAGLGDRAALLDSAPAPFALSGGIHASIAG